MSSREALEATIDTGHPDALVQIAQLFRTRRTGDLVISAAAGYDLRERFEWPHHFSSHGGLIRDHMLIPVASSVPLADGPIRSADVATTVLDYLGVPAPSGADGVSRLERSRSDLRAPGPAMASPTASRSARRRTLWRPGRCRWPRSARAPRRRRRRRWRRRLPARGRREGPPITLVARNASTASTKSASIPTPLITIQIANGLNDQDDRQERREQEQRVALGEDVERSNEGPVRVALLEPEGDERARAREPDHRGGPPPLAGRRRTSRRQRPRP